MLFRWENYIAVRHRLKLTENLGTWGIFFCIYFEPYEPLSAQKFENAQNKNHHTIHTYIEKNVIYCFVYINKYKRNVYLKSKRYERNSPFINGNLKLFEKIVPLKFKV